MKQIDNYASSPFFLSQIFFIFFQKNTLVFID